MEVAALAVDEICNRDGDRLERPRSSPTSDKAITLPERIESEKLRPQLVDLMESFGYAVPAKPLRPKPVFDGAGLNSPVGRGAPPPHVQPPF
jgi:hypothetical protein